MRRLVFLGPVNPASSEGVLIGNSSLPTFHRNRWRTSDAEWIEGGPILGPSLQSLCPKMPAWAGQGLPQTRSSLSFLLIEQALDRQKCGGECGDRNSSWK